MILNAISAWLVKEQVIKPEDKNLYVYALSKLLLGLAPVFIALALGFILGIPLRALIFIFPYMCIRKFSGGFHLKNPLACLILSTVVLTCALVVIKYSDYYRNSIIDLVAVLVSIVMIIVFSPISSQARPLSIHEATVFGKIARLLILIFALSYLVLRYCHLPQYSIPIGAGIVLVAFLQVPSIIIRWIRP